MDHLPFNLDPAQVLLVDPKLTRDLGKHAAVLALAMVARVWRRLNHIGRPAVDCFFADQLQPRFPALVRIAVLRPSVGERCEMALDPTAG